MKPLIFKTETIHTIEYFDWDSFIEDNFPDCKYEGIVAEEDMTNDSTFTCKSFHIDEDKKEKIKSFLSGSDELFIHTRDIISYLASEKIIPEGLYNIDICW